MVQASELRIGNYVTAKINVGKVTKETIIQINGVYKSTPDPSVVSTVVCYSRTIDCKDLKPIPLSPELLVENCGFEKMPLSSVQRYRSTETLFFIQLYKKEWYVYGYKYYPNGFKYLHELQNLFYILVGRELPITKL